jgi:hypothetical protein
MNPTLTIYASLRIAGLTALTAFACTSLYAQPGSAVDRDYSRVLAIAAPQYYVVNEADEDLRRQLAAALAQAEQLDPETLACLDRLVLWITPLDLLQPHQSQPAVACGSMAFDLALGPVDATDVYGAAPAVAAQTLLLRHALEPQGP